ncbi:MAG: hypothetical protein Q9160_008786 [Pyrenula sp. 1 TL-2023]
MASRPKNSAAKTAKRQFRTGRHRVLSVVKKPKQAPGTRKSLRLQNQTPVSYCSSLQPVQSSSTSLIPVSQPACAKRKCSQDSEVEAGRSVKQPRRSRHLEPFEKYLPKVSEVEAKADDLEPPPISEESEEDLRKLYKEVMESAANNASTLKRTSSRRSTFLSEANTVRSQRSSNTTAHYRYKHLKNANVYIHVDPPEDIQAAIENIINIEPSKDRHAVLHHQAQKFSKRCEEMVQAAAGEDDFVHLFYNFMEDISPDNLISREKADWRVELKPTIRQLNANLSFLLDFDAMGSDKQQEVNDTLTAPPLPKRHQPSNSHLYTPPRKSQTPSSVRSPENRPPQQDKAKETSLIRTPRPDITTGIKESAVISALASSLLLPNFDYTEAEQFLEKLQDATIPSQRDSPQEQVLIIVPTQRESNLAFPALIFEGKGYSTGKQIFEAQNQAAVSGASGLKIQLMLDELIKRATRSSEPLTNQPPLVFSICSEGPQHELWAHYTVIEDGERRFNMVLLNTGHGMVLKQVEKLFVQVDNIINWAVGQFLKSVVDGLEKVARKAMA